MWVNFDGSLKKAWKALNPSPEIAKVYSDLRVWQVEKQKNFMQTVGKCGAFGHLVKPAC